MRALCCARKGDVRVDTVPDRRFNIRATRIIKITPAQSWDSDLHLFVAIFKNPNDGPAISSHENMGE